MSHHNENLHENPSSIGSRVSDTRESANITCSTDDTHTAPASALLDTGLHEKIIAIGPVSEALPVAKVGQVESGLSTYPIDKLDAHLQNIPHAAISIFVFSHKRLLLQQRAATKYHSAGLWANTVCSHPRWQETASTCAQRRLQEELGWTTRLTEGEKIEYHAKVGDLYENEQVQCYFGSLQNEPETDTTIEKLSSLCNPGEVSGLRWMNLQEIDSAISNTPEIFSAWFKIYMSIHRDKLQRMMEAATSMRPALHN